MPRTALQALRNEDYSDRELLHIVMDHGDTDGWITIHDLADILGIKCPHKSYSDKAKQAYASRCVATRFAWMTRWKFVQRDKKHTMLRVTSAGRDLANGKLTKGLTTSLDRLSEGDRVLVMRELATAYRRGTAPGATMVRREWQRGAQRNGR